MGGMEVGRFEALNHTSEQISLFWLALRCCDIEATYRDMLLFTSLDFVRSQKADELVYEAIAISWAKERDVSLIRQ
jgi:hypothetical protein